MATVAAFNSVVALTGTSTAMSQEAMTEDSADVWHITDTTKDVFDPTTSFTVEASEDGGSNYNTLGTDEYTMRYLVGVVEIDNYTTASGNPDNITDVRVSGNYLPRHTLVEGHTLALDATAEALDDTVNGDNGRSRIQGLKDASGSFEVRNVPDTPIDGMGGSEDSLETLFSDGTRLVLTFDIDGNGGLIARAAIKFFDYSLGQNVEDLVNKVLGFSGAKFDAADTNQTSQVVDFYTP